MAGKAPAVSVEQAENGDYSIGATIDGIFVPFVSASEGHVAGKVAKGKAAKGSSSSSDSEDES